MKIVVRAVSILLSMIVVALAFVFFSPDYDVFFVRSESMKPAINIGDMIIAGPAGVIGGIKSGTIVTYESGQDLVTHRVVSVNGDTLITKGDANEEPDPSPILFSQVKSRYLFKISYAGYLSGFMQTRLGWFFIIILPGILMAGYLVKDIVKEALKRKYHVKNIYESGKDQQSDEG